MSLWLCENCKQPVQGEPWVSHHRDYLYSCTPQCKAKVDAMIEREKTHQRSLALGHRCFNGS